MPTQPPPDTRAELTAIDGLTLDRTIRRTDKTLLAAGTYHGRDAVVKLLLDRSTEWAHRWRHEIAVYHQFTTRTPPVNVPALLYTDDQSVMILEHVDGQVLDTERYPSTPPTAANLAAVLGALRSLNHWRHPDTAAPGGQLDAAFPAMDYRARVARYHQAGYLTDLDRAALDRLIDDSPPPTQINHGDPLPSNILIDPQHDVTLLDWEFAGAFTPGYDLAVLHTLLSAHASAQQIIDELVDQDALRRPFTLNRVAVLTRELRIHRELPDGDLRARRLALLETAWSAARRDLHAL